MTKNTTTAVILAMIIIMIACVYLVRFPSTPLRSGAGFGSEWDCIPQARGEPVCSQRSSDKNSN